MRTGLAVLLLSALFLPATVARADTVGVGNFVEFDDRPGSPGGEFLVTVFDTIGGSPIDQFITFCIQKSEFMNFTSTFVVGGVSTSADDPSPDPLDQRSAYLYTQFRNGTLAGYTLGSAISANLLQNAIWWFEGEANVGNQSTNPFVVLAQNAVNSGAWSGLGNVRVLNLFYMNGAKAQDQLTLVPVPEPSTLALLGVGLAAVGLRRRRLSAS